MFLLLCPVKEPIRQENAQGLHGLVACGHAAVL